jgi:hypothetical protein
MQNVMYQTIGVQVMDYEELHKLASTKMDYFFEQAEKAKNKYIKNRYRTVAFFCLVSMHTYTALNNCRLLIPDFEKARKEITNETNKEVVHDIDDSLHNLESTNKPITNIQESKLPELVAKLEEIFLKIDSKLENIEKAALENCIQYYSNSIPKIFEYQDIKFFLQSALEGCLLIASMFPGGNLIGVVTSIKKIFSLEKEELNNADDLLNRLDNFEFGIIAWNIGAQILIDTIEHRKENNYELNFKQAGNSVSRRFEQEVKSVENSLHDRKS